MVCDEKIRLVAEYAEASSLLHSAVTKLRAGAGKENEGHGKAVVAGAKTKCVNARLALRDHKALHGC